MSVHFTSLKGLRDQNEDKHNIIINIDNKRCNYKNVNLFAIYDGHGGKEVSTFLSEKLPSYFMDSRVVYPLEKRYVIKVFDHMQGALEKQGFSKNMGSTCLVVLHFKYNNNQYLNVINSGDCRAVICRDNFAHPLTKDHKPHWPEERHRIEKLGGTITWDGFDWRIRDLSVSRAFGDTDATPYVTHRPDLFRYRLDKNDKFIIIACDGLWDVMSSQDAVNFVLMNAYDQNIHELLPGIRNKKIDIAKKLAEYALKKKSKDNVSVIVYFFK